MPEIKKYLNRDGLDEYNSLLPHSSGEMQEYVNDWLDEHPEATTTVQDGAITEPKLADKSVSLRTLADDTVHMLKGMILTREISGEVLTADDAYSAPAVSLTIGGKSTQDGTPTPDTPAEIVSLEQVGLQFAGKNVFDSSLLLRAPYSSFDGEYYTVSGYRLNQVFPLSNGGFPVPIDGRQVALSFDGMNVSGGASTTGINFIFVYEDNTTQTLRVQGETLAHYSMVSTAGKTLKALRFSYNTNVDAKLKNIQFEYGSTATEYQPYDGTSVLLNLTQALRSLPDGTKDTLALTYLRPSTREGWAWYTPEVTRLIDGLLFPEMRWTYRAADVGSTGQAQSRFTARFNAFGIASGIRPTNCFCSAYAVQARSGDRNTIFPDGSIYQLTGYASLYQNGVTDSRFNNVADFLAANANTEIVAKLIVPTIETLDPIELPILPAPECTVWCDPSTGLQMEYVRDSNIVIQRIEEAIADQ